MKLKTLLLSGGALAGLAVSAYAAGHGNMADSMTIVSWGGAYQKSQINAYSAPYQAMNDGLEVIWDESSNEAVAKMRAMYEAGNVTWDLVDVEGPDATRLCDEGLAMEIDFEPMLAPGDDGSTPADDFGDSLINDCFIPQIVFSTTFGYRTDVESWGGNTPDDLCDVFDLEAFPGKRALEKRP
ncbi:ABC transporter substrate-binding protein, partial [Escherichia coli]|nr:ABC transporter substrate-binding protein [Escherichia coli]